jgi:tRNA threonylcarbamoyladenosine biosynthesis protein TsaE
MYKAIIVYFLDKIKFFLHFYLTFLEIMIQIYKKSELDTFFLEIFPWDIIFLRWDLAAGKTTLSKHIINNLLKQSQEVHSPTYTYYNKYEPNIYHFDLYRLGNYDEFFAIGWEEILDNWENISLIEWPDIIEKYYKPTVEIFLTKTQNEDERQIEVRDYRK